MSIDVNQEQERTETVESGAVEGLATDESAAQEQETTPLWRRWVARLRRRTAIATALSVLLLAGTGAFAWQATHLPGAGALRDRALTDQALTAQAQGQVDSALETVLSYAPDDVAATQSAADRLLGGQAAEQYRTLFGRIAPLAQQQKLTLTTTVVRSGVESLRDGQAVLLVFLDQTASRPGGTPSVVPAELSVTAESVGGRWLITSLDVR